jgi:hypothetical protein
MKNKHLYDLLTTERKEYIDSIQDESEKDLCILEAFNIQYELMEFEKSLINIQSAETQPKSLKLLLFMDSLVRYLNYE